MAYKTHCEESRLSSRKVTKESCCCDHHEDDDNVHADQQDSSGGRHGSHSQDKAIARNQVIMTVDDDDEFSWQDSEDEEILYQELYDSINEISFFGNNHSFSSSSSSQSCLQHQQQQDESNNHHDDAYPRRSNLRLNPKLVTKKNVSFFPLVQVRENEKNVDSNDDDDDDGADETFLAVDHFYYNESWFDNLSESKLAPLDNNQEDTILLEDTADDDTSKNWQCR